VDFHSNILKNILLIVDAVIEFQKLRMEWLTYFEYSQLYPSVSHASKF
jgi:hypothetical protein